VNNFTCLAKNSFSMPHVKGFLAAVFEKTTVGGKSGCKVKRMTNVF
jgi:hypothetical protein